MTSRSDRRDLAVVGLWVLSWALVLAPLLHSVTHEHGQAHSHGALPSESHGAGSTAHLQAVFVEPAVTLDVVFAAQRVAVASATSPQAPHVERWNSVEEPQGP